ncbi:MAG: hemolysin III family protein [Clostridiales bacterium]|jgi:hemolysin III|nr:hemolysin III family protein [Clostridiales bacterium]
MNSDLTENRGSLPNYSEGEEIFHVCSHAVGVLLGIGMMITVLVCYQNTFQLISGVIFGLSLIILYSVSCTYHGLSAKGPELEDKKNFQVVDHCSITLLIIGTQAPFALCILESAKSGFGWAIYGAVCAIACPVIILNILDLNRFKAVTMIGYFLMGGCLLVGMDILIPALTWQGFALFMAIKLSEQKHQEIVFAREHSAILFTLDITRITRRNENEQIHDCGGERVRHSKGFGGSESHSDCSDACFIWKCHKG